MKKIWLIICLVCLVCFSKSVFADENYIPGVMPYSSWSQVGTVNITHERKIVSILHIADITLAIFDNGDVEQIVTNDDKIGSNKPTVYKLDGCKVYVFGK